MTQPAVLWSKAFYKTAVILLPFSVFYYLYHRDGLLPAGVAAVAISAATVLYDWVRSRRFPVSRGCGLLGIGLSVLTAVLSSNEKLYFVPQLISNLAFLVLFVALAVKKKNIFPRVGAEMGVAIPEDIDKDSLNAVNRVWIVYYALKIAVKLVGLFAWKFSVLYLVTFLLGDPTTCVLVLATGLLVGGRLARGEEGAR